MNPSGRCFQQERSTNMSSGRKTWECVLGLRLPYRSRRPVFVSGVRFAQNLAENWKVRGVVGNYLVYEHE